LSSTEAEYIALSNSVKEAISLGRLEESKEPILIFEDNQSTINISNNPIRNERSKHIDVRFHFIREKVNNKEIEIKYCSTDKMVADIMTKPLKKILHARHCHGLGLLD